MYSPYDCSADSDLTSYRPKRSASIMPPVSYSENARIKLGFFTRGWFVHPLLKINITAQYFFRKAEPHIVKPLREEREPNRRKENFVLVIAADKILISE